ncbi:MAG: hypothetical protein AB1491_04610 [Thermodesulfobacteriota bacterium]
MSFRAFVDLFLTYAGFFLILILFSEDFRRLCQWLKGRLEERPALKILAYPLAAGLLLIAAGLIATSLLRLFFGLRFSYD